MPASTVVTTPNPVFFEANPTVMHDLNFGNFELIAISGTAFDDLDADGARDPGEPGIPGILIELDLGADGTVDDTALSGAAGAFSFGNLGPGTHRIRQVLPGERVPTTAPPADIVAGSGADTTGIIFGSGPTPVPALDLRGLALLAILLALVGFKLARGGLRS